MPYCKIDIFDVSKWLLSGGHTAHGRHGDGRVPVLDCLVEDFAKYVVRNRNSNVPVMTD